MNTLIFPTFRSPSVLRTTESKRHPVIQSKTLMSYDCTGQHGTYHPHPFDCSRYIQCHNGRTADYPCVDCSGGKICGGKKYLFWDQPLTVCNWPPIVPSDDDDGE